MNLYFLGILAALVVFFAVGIGKPSGAREQARMERNDAVCGGDCGGGVRALLHEYQRRL